MADDFLRGCCPSGSLLWYAEPNVLGTYSILDTWGRGIASTADECTAKLIADEHNTLLETEQENETLRTAMSEDQQAVADTLVDLKAAIKEAQELAGQIIIESNKLNPKTVKLHPLTIQRLTKLSERKF